jgi:hypothetical protein
MLSKTASGFPRRQVSQLRNLTISRKATSYFQATSFSTSLGMHKIGTLTLLYFATESSAGMLAFGI